MPAVTPTTEVFAFSAPQVKQSGDVGIAIRVPGGLHVLRASRTVWRGLHDHLAALFAPPPSLQVASAALPAAGRRGGRTLSPARLDLYRRALADWQAGRLTQAQAAAAHGLKFSTFQDWIARTRRRERAEAARRAPVTKPSGALL